MAAEQFVSLGLSFFVGVTVVRYLGPEATGAFNYAGAIAGLLGPLATLGLESIIIRELAKGDAARSEIWQTARKLLWAVTGLNTLILAVIALTQAPGGLQQTALLAATISSLSNASTIHLWALRAASQYRKVAKIRLLQMIGLQAIKLAMVHFHAPFIAFAAIIAIDPLLLALATLKLATANLSETIGNASASFVRGKQLLVEAWPIILTGFGIMIYTRIDVVMLEKLSGINDVGIYSAATRLSELWTFVPFIFVRAAYPQMVKLAETEPDRYTKIHRQLLFLLLGISLAVGCATQLGADRVILFLYGKGFAASAAPLKIHIWSAISIFVGVHVSTSYQIFGINRPPMWGCLVGSISNVILNFLWIPTHGPSGSAAATAVSYGLSVITPMLCSRTCWKIALGNTIPAQL